MQGLPSANDGPRAGIEVDAWMRLHADYVTARKQENEIALTCAGRINSPDLVQRWTAISDRCDALSNLLTATEPETLPGLRLKLALLKEGREDEPDYIRMIQGLETAVENIGHTFVRAAPAQVRRQLFRQIAP